MRKYVVVLLLSVALITGCSSSTSKDDKTKTDYLSGTEHADAKALFKSNRCITCHATDLSGTAGLNSNLQHVGSRLTKEEIVDVITNGKRTMPAQKDKLSSEEIQELADWLVGLK